MSEIADPTLEEEVAVKVEPPKRYHVIMLNDDFTTMEFVVMVLVEYFEMDEIGAAALMVQIHNEGQGIAGIYSYEVADQKAKDTMDLANVNGMPLRCKVEEAPTT